VIGRDHSKLGHEANLVNVFGAI